jgi:hypothetical protein
LARPTWGLAAQEAGMGVFDEALRRNLDAVGVAAACLAMVIGSYAAPPRACISGCAALAGIQEAWVTSTCDVISDLQSYIEDLGLPDLEVNLRPDPNL